MLNFLPKSDIFKFSFTNRFSTQGPSIKYVTLFFANFDPLPCTLCHTSRDPQKYVTHLGPPRFLVGLVQKSRTKVSCTNSISIVRGGFCAGWFMSVPPRAGKNLRFFKKVFRFLGFLGF